MKTGMMIAAALLAYNTALFAAAALSPDTLKVPYNRATSKQVRYTMTEPATCSQAASSGIEVLDETLGLMTTISTPLNIALTNGSGAGSENIRIDRTVLEMAREKGSHTIYYHRNFTITCSLAPTTDSSDLRIDISTQSGSDFSINRLELYFDNKQPNITVAMHDELHVFASIGFNGSGILRGYWRVDGRNYPPVTKALSGRESVVLELAPLGSLPTFNPGLHRVEFVVSSPVLDVESPYALYLVGNEQSDLLLPIALTFPDSHAMLYPNKALFRWALAEDVSSYLIEFFRFDQNEALYAAYVKEGRYTIPPYISKKKFQSGSRYYWQVTGLDQEGKAVAKSAPRIFTFLVH